MPNFQVSAKDPAVVPDAGAGQWASSAPTNKMMALKLAIIRHLPLAVPLTGFDAVRHMYHFFINSGETLKIDFEKLVSDL